MFDGLNLPFVCADLYSNGVMDDQLKLLFNMNSNNRARVTTPVGKTEMFELNENVFQGGPWGPIMAACQTDFITKRYFESHMKCYTYRDSIEIGPLTMLDDLLTISYAGPKTEIMAAFINMETRLNNYQFSHKKCVTMEVGKSFPKHLKTVIYFDKWTSKESEDPDTKEIKVKEKFIGKFPIKEVSNQRYLGYELSNDGTNNKDIEIRINNGRNIIRKIKLMLDSLFLGEHYFKVGKTLIDSLLLGSILCNLEVAYNLTKGNITKLENIHEEAIRTVLSLPRTSPKKMLYLLMGAIPISFLLSSRRICYLHHILNQNENSLLKKFYFVQDKSKNSTDWASSVNNDLVLYNLNAKYLTSMSKLTLKKYLKNMNHKLALQDLNDKQGTKSYKFSELKMANFLNSKEINTEMAKFIVKIKCRMVEECPMNFKNKYTEYVCNICNLEDLDQEHLLMCKQLLKINKIVSIMPNYQDVYEDDVIKLKYIAEVLIENIRNKEEIENIDKEKERENEDKVCR